jgi:hypothetical protein
MRPKTGNNSMAGSCARTRDGRNYAAARSCIFRPAASVRHFRFSERIGAKPRSAGGAVRQTRVPDHPSIPSIRAIQPPVVQRYPARIEIAPNITSG